jgi:hypothetical protein
MWYLIIILAVWIVGIFVAYNKFISKWERSKGEKIYFSIIWPLVAPLYLIHLIHNKL